MQLLNTNMSYLQSIHFKWTELGLILIKFLSEWKHVTTQKVLSKGTETGKVLFDLVCGPFQ